MRPKFAFLLVVMLAFVWVLYGFLGDRVASHISSRFGSKILAHGDGKFTNVQVFVKNRLKDGAVLVTAACILLLVYRQLSAVATRRLRTPGRWIVQGWGAFICLNAFAACAAHHTLFWCLLFTGKDHTHNYTQWCIKQGLMKEIEAPGQAVLLGASTTRTQIDTKVLNDRLGRSLWTTELHFPGAGPYDMVLCLERVPRVRVDYVITYANEVTFFSQNDQGRLMFFFGLRDLPNYWTLGPGKPAIDRFLICGLLGDVFPLYRVWEPLVARARFWQSEDVNQKKYDQALDNDLVRRAQTSARHMGFGTACNFNKKEFAVFAKMCAERHSRLVICCGQLNPILDRALDPALHSDMMAFLHELARNDPNVILLEESQFPKQVESDYEDLTHVDKAARARFSQALAETLDKWVKATPSKK
jgi:multisubunit Na+/H+ antiporter MnhB subunit